jgi:hypothetical protein
MGTPSDPSKDACSICGPGAVVGGICCFSDTGDIKSGKCSDDSFCDKSTGKTCTKGGTGWNSFCDPADTGSCGGISGLSCQKVDGLDNVNRCLCVDDYLPCNKDGTKMCDPGATPVPPAGKYAGTCEAGGKCADSDWMCLESSDETVKGTCAPTAARFDELPACTSFCGPSAP